MRTIFSGANLLDGTGSARADVSVVVNGDRIESVGTAPIGVTCGDVVYDLGGATLMPGMGSAHFHGEFRYTNLAQPDEIYFGSERPGNVLFAVAINSCRNMLQSGFTMAASAGCSNDIDACLIIGMNDGLFAGPRLLPCGNHIEATSTGNDRAKWWYDQGNTGFSRFVDGPDDIRKEVRRQIKRGAEILKIFATDGHAIADPVDCRGLSPDEISAAVETAHMRGRKVRAHCVFEPVIKECVKAGVDLIDHGDHLTEEIIELMVEHGTYWVPSMRILEVVLGMSGADGLEFGHDWDNLVKMLPLANAAGLKIVPGDDYGIAIMPHDPGIYATEFETYVRQGIDPIDVLRWATVNVADLLGRPGELGVIVEGALADLVVVDGDPSVNIALLSDPTANVCAVMKDGAFHKNELIARAS